MSSTYRRICLSHDPLLVIDEIEVASVPPGNPSDHPNCVIALGRWSGGLVEIWLPIGRISFRGGQQQKLAGDWFDVSWMSRFASVAQWVMRDARLGVSGVTGEQETA